MGGSGLIVVVIVAAWALFLVPQWMHRRASAAAHLADRVAVGVAVGDEDGDGVGPDEADAASAAAGRPSRRFGRRHLQRRPLGQDEPRGRFARWRGRAAGRRDAAARVAQQRSPAARRRRIVVVLALSTLLTAIVVGVSSAVGLSVPVWAVAVPGGLMVAYLLLLALVRPGAAPAKRRPARPDVAGDAVDPGSEQEQALVLAPAQVVAAPGAAPALDPVPTAAVVQQPAEPDTWTPVPLPTPTYVTAPRARRSVRTIDLSNPGSWTASPAPAPGSALSAPAHESDDAGVAEADEQYPMEHRRAVGD